LRLLRSHPLLTDLNRHRLCMCVSQHHCQCIHQIFLQRMGDGRLWLLLPTHHALISLLRLLGRCLSMTSTTTKRTLSLRLRRLTNRLLLQHPIFHLLRHSRSLTLKARYGTHQSEKRRPSPRILPTPPPHWRRHSHPRMLTSPTLLHLLSLRQIQALHCRSEAQMGISPRQLYYHHRLLIHGRYRPMWGGRRVLVLRRSTRTRGRELVCMRSGSVLMSGWCRLCFVFFLLSLAIHCNNR